MATRFDHTDSSIVDDITNYQKGNLPNPTVYLSDRWVEEFNHPLPNGHVIVITSKDDNVDYYYKVKEYKDGWYKLEWPD